MATNNGRCVSAAVAGTTPAVDLFPSLAEETGLRMVARLAAGEARVVDPTGELRLARSTVAKHLPCLCACGLVDRRTEARPVAALVDAA